MSSLRAKLHAKRSAEKLEIAALQDQNNDVPPSRKASAGYVKFINERLAVYCRAVLERISVSGETAAEYYQRLADLSASVGGYSSGVGRYESSVREDFNSDSVHFRNLQVIELAQCASDLLYLRPAILCCTHRYPNQYHPHSGRRGGRAGASGERTGGIIGRCRR
jgi:hypothetical protein